MILFLPSVKDWMMDNITYIVFCMYKLAIKTTEEDE
jgi:hypothetical protein